MEQYSIDAESEYPIIKAIPEEKFLGVCAWLAYKLSIDVVIMRLIFVLAFIFGFGSPLIFYFFLAIIKIAVD